MTKHLPAALALVLAATLGLGTAAGAQNGDPLQSARSLDQLLDEVRKGRLIAAEEMQRREREFLQRKNEQEQLLAQARATRRAEEQRSERLETAFEENEIKLAETEELLKERLGSLGELFGVVRQVAGDTAAQLESSVVSAQYPGRTEFLHDLAQRKELPRIAELERLWYSLQQEMTESGKVMEFPATVTLVDGTDVQRDVVRVGVFNVVTDGKFLRWNSGQQKLEVLPRQPAGRHQRAASRLADAEEGLVAMSVDPSRGQILSLLVETPGLSERIAQGGIIGYITIGLGVLGVLFIIYRFAVLTLVSRKIRAQMKDPKPSPDNPLGRVMAAYEENRGADVETLELKLDEAILKDTPALERGLATVKVLSVIAPLLGLLGTVTGMIVTFQSITLFGTGDPKLMAGGISQALVTTVIGLCVAIPLTFLHSLVSSQSKGIIQVLEEQSAGLVAAHAEEEGSRRGDAV